MPGEAIGEPISLIWEGDPEDYFVKGHLSEKEALDALNREELLEKGYPVYNKGTWGRDWQWYKPILSPALHRYARWSMEPGPEDCHHVLRDYAEPGRGRFPVTMFHILGWQKIDSPVYDPTVSTPGQGQKNGSK